MSRQKEKAKPLFAVKHDFYASLDAFAHQSVMLLQAVETALELNCVSDKIRPSLQERVDAFREALVTSEEEG